MELADPDIIESRIKATLNASKTFGGAIATKARTALEITEARRAAAVQVIRAIGANPKGDYYGEYVVDVALAYDVDGIPPNLPAHIGEPGIPMIVPFPGGTARAGVPLDADEIDAYRTSPELFTGGEDNEPVPHNEKGSEEGRSPLSCFYNITGSRLRFTGDSCEVPLFPEPTEDMADGKIPFGYGPAVHKGAIPLLLKEGDNLIKIANGFANDAKQDLIEIAGGSMKLRPTRSVADVAAEQKVT